MSRRCLALGLGLVSIETVLCFVFASCRQVHSACDERNNTLVTYQWVEPRICRDDLPSSAKLPSGAERRKCPPCNPGMQMDYTTGTCRFCPAGSISDGIRPCRPCSPSTAPNTGFQFIWWSALPATMSSRCMSLEGIGLDDLF